MTEPDELADTELSRYDTGRRHGIGQVLDHPALADVALELTLLRVAYAALAEELKKRDRTIAAYRAIIRG